MLSVNNLSFIIFNFIKIKNPNNSPGANIFKLKYSSPDIIERNLFCCTFSHSGANIGIILEIGSRTEDIGHWTGHRTLEGGHGTNLF